MATRANTPAHVGDVVIHESARLRKNARAAITDAVKTRVPQVDDLTVIFE